MPTTPIERPSCDAGHPGGACVWLTGLSGAGKTTAAGALADRLRAFEIPTKVLDGDEVRSTYTIAKGFSKAERDAHVRHVATLAREVVDCHAVAICALISPWRDSRSTAKTIVGCERFVEVFVNTPLAICAARDPKGLYARARRGELLEFSGIDSPYEPPTDPDLVIDTTSIAVWAAVDAILAVLHRRSLLPWSRRGTVFGTPDPRDITL